jgi:hypothetical protein
VKGITVQHIMPTGKLQTHTLTQGGKVVDGKLTYPPPEADKAQRLFD